MRGEFFADSVEMNRDACYIGGSVRIKLMEPLNIEDAPTLYKP